MVFNKNFTNYLTVMALALFTSCYEIGFVSRTDYDAALKRQERLATFYALVSTANNNFISSRQFNDYLYYGSYDDSNASIYNISNLCANVYTSFSIPEGKLVNAWTQVSKRTNGCAYNKFTNLKCLVGNSLEIIEIIFPDTQFATRRDQCETIIKGILIY
jgi:hypothetical protein